MILQLAALVYGVFVLATGRFHLGKGRAAVGAPARLAGVILVATPILGFALGFVLGAMRIALPSFAYWGIGFGMLVGSLLAAWAVADRGAKAQEMDSVDGAYGAPPMA